MTPRIVGAANRFITSSPLGVAGGHEGDTRPRRSTHTVHAWNARKIAGYLAVLATSLEKTGHAPRLEAEFLAGCLFCMFAEDAAVAVGGRRILPRNAKPFPPPRAAEGKVWRFEALSFGPNYDPKPHGTRDLPGVF